MNTIPANDLDTIVAAATPPGRGGVGIVRISGPLVCSIADQILRRQKKGPLQPRYAHYAQFIDADSELIDEGIALYFPKPNSFTGEEVIELQGHGGPVVMDRIIRRATQLGARLARPGEFSERAFLNDKLDLAQAEAIADLIDSSSEQAARSAMNSLKGVFSNKIRSLVESLIHLRMYVEAAIDFPEEEIDFLADQRVQEQLVSLLAEFENVSKEARQGTILREGMNVVLAGRPNAGKSSLLNALAGEDRAIVTSIAGTTRDVLREHIHIDGMPLHIVDTAGLRESPDEVEIEGIKRALEVIRSADQVLLVIDASLDQQATAAELWRAIWTNEISGAISSVEQDSDLLIENFQTLIEDKKVTLIRNKIDLCTQEPEKIESDEGTVIQLSAKHQTGMDLLRDHLKKVMGFEQSNESQFSARRRHLDALARAQAFVLAGQNQLKGLGAGELLAEDLRQAQQCLGVITGDFTSDDLLGRIFSSFCIGK